MLKLLLHIKQILEKYYNQEQMIQSQPSANQMMNDQMMNEDLDESYLYDDELVEAQRGMQLGQTYDTVETGEGLLNENNFIKTKRKWNGKIKQKEISEKRFNRMQDRYERKGGYDGGDNSKVFIELYYFLKFRSF